MRNLIFFMHASLDGFVAGPDSEMDWIKVDEEIFDFVSTITEKADIALYGRVTYEMMQSYWPTAAEQPNASKHDIEHAEWYSKVSKVVLSKTMSQKQLANTTIIADNVASNINKIKEQGDKNILIFGSPAASDSLLGLGLIDEFWILVNPVLLGNGRPLFKSVSEITKLNLIESKAFLCGVIALHYETIRN